MYKILNNNSEGGRQRVICMMVSKWMLALVIATSCLQSGPILGNSIQKDNPYDILIIVNLGRTEKSISTEYLRALFLANKNEWPDGGKVVAINAKDNTDLRQAFRNRLLGMSNLEENRYWEERKVQNGTNKILEFNDTLRSVFHLKNSISYVFRKDFYTNTAKVIAVLRE